MVGKEKQKPLIGNPFLKLDRNRPRKMVFYGRVSTEHEAQLSALENQIQWYDDQAKYHPNWTVLDKYIDEGITGTQAKKRPAFLRMLEDARAGKFDLIVTREVCRFARNTVDTLVTTRELKDIGIEVYFVEDNIWTLDGDGELRLTIMATLAQEESRKVSERVKAGQQISRENGTPYGTGNILGYDRIDGKYVINPEQAKTVRMIYDMYLKDGLGCMKIANELTRLGRLNASGIVKWQASCVSRVLLNPTYMGVMAYGKSYSNNFLDQKRVLNRDPETYMYVKCDFEPIITEAEYLQSKALHARRTQNSKNGLTSGTGCRHGVHESKDVWTSRLKCKCGSNFRKNINHKNKNEITYGYICYSQINTGSARKMVQLGADPTGHCDMTMIPDWKLEMMGERILRMIWGDTKPAIEKACELIRKCYTEETKKPEKITFDPTAEIDRLSKKLQKYLELYTDDCITKEEFNEQKKKITQTIEELRKQNTAEDQRPEKLPVKGINGLDHIRQVLEEMLDFSGDGIDREIYRKFVARIEAVDKTHFRWYMNLDGTTESEIDAIAEGRKTSPEIMIEDRDQNPEKGADGEDSSAPLYIIEENLQDPLDSVGEACYNSHKENTLHTKSAYLLSDPHRPLSSRRNKRTGNPAKAPT